MYCFEPGSGVLNAVAGQRFVLGMGSGYACLATVGEYRKVWAI